MKCPSCEKEFCSNPIRKAPALWSCRCTYCGHGWLIDGNGEMINEKGTGTDGDENSEGREEIHS